MPIIRHALNTSTRGVTLIELLATITIVVAVIASTATLFPKASRAIATNRQRLFAAQLAQMLMQQANKIPYPLLDPTPETSGPTGNFPTNGTGTGQGKCDCNTAQFGNLPNFSTVTNNIVTYSQATCVNFVDPGTLASYCPSYYSTGTPPPADPGLKTIHVRVWWTAYNIPLSIDLQSKMSRT
jgi:type II secretory pathway pseudopilin PulG